MRLLLVCGVAHGVSAQTQLGGDIFGEADNDNFGRSVSLSADGSRVAIGAPAIDGNGINAGQVRMVGLRMANRR